MFNSRKYIPHPCNFTIKIKLAAASVKSSLSTGLLIVVHIKFQLEVHDKGSSINYVTRQVEGIHKVLKETIGLNSSSELRDFEIYN